jgi:hypothetical protein
VTEGFLRQFDSFVVTFVGPNPTKGVTAARPAKQLIQIHSFNLAKEVIMKSNHLFAVATLAVLVSAAAHADDAVAPEHTKAFQGSRTRAEVMAEAAQVSRNRSNEPAGSRVAPIQSTLERANVRAQAVEAVRLGQIPSGERSAI